MIKCDICHKEFDKKKSFSNHRRWHDLPEYKEFQEKFKNNIKSIKKTIEWKEKIRNSNIGKHNHKGKRNPMYGKNYKCSEKTKQKLSRALKGRKPWNTGKKCPQLSGVNHHAWNPNRDQVKKHYTLRFYFNREFRNKILEFQYKRDLLTGNSLKSKMDLHHFNKDKTDDSHFIKNDDYCNLGFLNRNTHKKCDYQKNFEEYKEILVKNTIALIEGRIPKSWNKKNKELLMQEKLIQKQIINFIKIK